MSAPESRRPWVKWLLAPVLLYVIYMQFQLGHPGIAVVFCIALLMLVGLEILVRRAP